MSSRAKLSIDELVRAADRELSAREAAYPGLVASGRITQSAADYELQAQRQIVDTLVLFQRFEGPIRETVIRRLADIRAIERHPAMEAIREVFPEATLFIRDASGVTHQPDASGVTEQREARGPEA